MNEPLEAPARRSKAKESEEWWEEFLDMYTMSLRLAAYICTAAWLTS